MKDKHYHEPRAEVLQLITEQAFLASSVDVEGLELTIKNYSEEETVW